MQPTVAVVTKPSIWDLRPNSELFIGAAGVPKLQHYKLWGLPKHCNYGASTTSFSAEWMIHSRVDTICSVKVYRAPSPSTQVSSTITAWSCVAWKRDESYRTQNPWSSIQILQMLDPFIAIKTKLQGAILSEKDLSKGTFAKPPTPDVALRPHLSCANATGNHLEMMKSKPLELCGIKLLQSQNMSTPRFNK